MKPNHPCAIVVLIAALTFSTSIKSIGAAPAAAPQEDSLKTHKAPNRVYDRAHKDYHMWDTNEDRAYRQYLKTQNQEYRDYAKLKGKQQKDYWNWRHNQPPYLE